jgi:hypothetical protein
MLNSCNLRALVCVCSLSAGLAIAAEPPTPSQPYQASINTSIWNTSGPGATTSSASFSGPVWSIPANKILVVEHVSARVRVNPGEKVNVSITCQSSATINLGLSEHQLVLTSVGQFDGLERLVGSMPLRCYTTSTLLVGLVRNAVGTVSPGLTEVAVSGFLVDPPK